MIFIRNCIFLERLFIFAFAVYQDPNDDDVKSPVLSRAIHKIDEDGSHDDEEVECLLQSSSSLHGSYSSSW